MSVWKSWFFKDAATADFVIKVIKAGKILLKKKKKGEGKFVSLLCNKAGDWIC